MTTWLPPMDVTETRDQIIITLGVEDADAIHVEVDEDQLIVYGETPTHFRRSVCLIEPIDPTHIESYVGEVSIEVRIPKTETASTIVA